MRRLLIYFFIVSSKILLGQNPVFNWATDLQSTGSSGGTDVAVDGLGNVYNTGYTEGTIDLDPGAGVYTVTSNGELDFYITKFDASGNFLWGKLIGGMWYDQVGSIAVDSQGNVFVAGHFGNDTVDFDPGPGTYTVGSTPYVGFILKLDTQGNFMWVKVLNNGPMTDAVGIAVDASANIYLTGALNNTLVDFDPGPATYFLSSSGSADVFVLKLNNNGNFIWAKSMGGSGSEYPTCISIDGGGNVCTAGIIFNSVADFDPGPATFTISSGGIQSVGFISKLDANGNFIWAKTIGSDLQCWAIASDALGNVYTTGWFGGISDFDPGPGTFTIASSGDADVFISKLNNSGSFVWTKKIGGTTADQGFAITTDQLGNVYTGGLFTGITDFDPGPGTYTLTSNSYDAFISKLDSSGNYVWAGILEDGTQLSTDIILGMTCDAFNNIYTTGYFNQVIDFDPGPTTYTLSPFGYDAFLQKLSPCTGTALAQNVTPGMTLCSGNSATLQASSSGLVKWFASATSSVAFANGSVFITPTLSAGSYTYFSEVSTCSLTYVRTSYTFNVSSNTTPVLSVTGNSAVCIGSPIILTAAGAQSYTWNTGAFSNSIAMTPTTNTSYSVAGRDTISGCINYVTKLITVNRLPVLNISGSNSICPASNATLAASGAATYVWGNNSTASTIAINSVSTSIYTVTGTDSNGCVSQISKTVTVMPNFLVSANSGTICRGRSFTITPSGASTYTITGGSAVVNPSVTTNYSIVGTSAVGCISNNTAVATITVYPWPTITVNSGSICSGSNFTFAANGASTYSFYNFVTAPLVNTTGIVVLSPTTSVLYQVVGQSIEGCVTPTSATAGLTVYTTPTIIALSGSVCSGNTFFIPVGGATTYTFSSGSVAVNPTITTSYSITGTSGAGCIASNTAVTTVTVHPIPSITVNSGSVCSQNSFLIIPQGATNYTYSGLNTALSGSVGNVVPTQSLSSYTVTGANSAGCVSQPAISVVTVVPRPIVSVNSSSICAGSSYTFFATGASSYTYNVSPFSVISSSLIVNSLVDTTILVVGTNTAGCVSLNPTACNLTVHPLPIISASNGSICAGQVFTFSPTGAFTYTFSSNSSTVNPVSTSSYSIIGTSSAGCVAAASTIVNVTVHPLPVISVNSGSICAGSIFTLVPSGALSYFYSSVTSTVMPISNTSYSVLGLSAFGCASSIPAIANVTVHSLPVVNVNSGTICAGGVFTLSPTGAFAYNFSGGSNTVTPLVTSSYFVTGISQVGCASANTAVATVTVNQSPTVSVNSGTICLGDTFTLLPQGANNYSVTGGQLYVAPTTNTIYYVTGSSSLNCLSINVATASITVLSRPQISVIGPTAVCIGSPVTWSAVGASTYSWSNNLNSNAITFTPVNNGSYFVVGTSSQGCRDTAFKSLVVNSLPTISASVSNSSICVSQSASIVCNGATSYTISGGVLNSVPFNPTVSATYTIIGRDINTCQNTATAAIVVFPQPTINVQATSTSVCMGDGVVLTASGASSYYWLAGPATSQYSVSPQSFTTYTVIGFDANGCSNMAQISVTVFSLPSVSITASSEFVCAGESVVLTAQGASTYQWIGGPSSSQYSIALQQSTTFTVIGVDQNGCKAQTQSSITFDKCTAITSLEEGGKVDLFPNPNDGKFTVYLDKDSYISVYTLDGKLIAQQVLSVGSTQVQLQDVKIGIYIVKIESAERTKYFKICVE